MGEDLEQVIRELKDKIMFIHFRNTTGCPTKLRETFHDNSDIDMACYVENSIEVTVRVDHVPTLAGEASQLAGCDALGRYFAIGYLKGIWDATKK